MELIPFAQFAFKCGVQLVWKFQRERELKKMKDNDVANRQFRELILTELDYVNSKLDKQARKDLVASKSFYKQGLENLNEVLINENTGKEGAQTTQSAKKTTAACNMTFFPNIADPLNDDLKRLNQVDLDEKAQKALFVAKKAFDKASDKATDAFSNEALDTSERIEAMTIRIMAKILENLEDPSIALPSCRSFLKDLHSMANVQDIFRRAVTYKGKKPAFSTKEEKIKIFVGVCHINRIIFDVTQLVGMKRGPWNWPCITVEEGQKIIHRIDPLRDVRVAEALCKLHKAKEETVLTNIADLSVAWSFGMEADFNEKLISPRSVATNTKGQFIVTDDGDRKIKVFNETGTFVHSFSPLSRRLADEDVFSVSTDREDNLFVLIKIDKYHYQLYLFDKHGKLFQIFPLREGIVRCSPIINDNNEILVIIEKKDKKISAVEVYKTGGEFVKSFGQEVLKEAKDVTIVDEGHLMVLNSDGSVTVFNANGIHQQELDFNHADGIPPDSIAFHAESKHVVISNSENGIRVKLSIYNEVRECVYSIYQGDERSETEDTKCVPPKIAVTKDGRIAKLAGMVGDYVYSFYQGDERSETEETKCIPPKIAVTKDGRIAILAGIVGESKVIVV